MKYYAKFFVLYSIGMLMFTGCASKVDSAAAQASVDSLPAAALVSNPAVEEPQAVGTAYEILGNMEMVAYCLPYPKNEFTEDYDRAAFKGQHVLVSKDQQSSITFSGNMLDMTWDELHAKCIADVGNWEDAKILTDVKAADALVLTWTEGGRDHYLKKWLRKADEETVTAHLAYLHAQAAQFQPWIETIAAHSTQCE